MSKLMHRFFGTYRQLDRGCAARNDLAWETDTQLEQLLHDTPFTMEADTITGTVPPSRGWLYAATHLFRSLIAHKRLLLFREFFALA